jgi:NDP-sugar pyrophosphorylase family protein
MLGDTPGRGSRPAMGVVFLCRSGGERSSALQIVVLAGGLGTRLGPVTGDAPKSLVPVNGRPFLDYELALFERSGIRDVVLCIGHLGDQIKRHCGDGSRFRLNIRYSEEREGPLGTAGAIRNAETLLANEFFLTYGDSYLLLDYRAVMDWFRQRDRLGLMVVYRNCNQLESSNVIVEGGFVKVYDKERRTPGMECINYGVSVLRKEAISLIPPGRQFSQEEFYQMLIEERQLLAFETSQRFYEIGSPAGLEEFRGLAGQRAIQ